MALTHRAKVCHRASEAGALCLFSGLGGSARSHQDRHGAPKPPRPVTSAYGPLPRLPKAPDFGGESARGGSALSSRQQVHQRIRVRPKRSGSATMRGTLAGGRRACRRGASRDYEAPAGRITYGGADTICRPFAVARRSPACADHSAASSRAAITRHSPPLRHVATVRAGSGAARYSPAYSRAAAPLRPPGTMPAPARPPDAPRVLHSSARQVLPEGGQRCRGRPVTSSAAAGAFTKRTVSRENNSEEPAQEVTTTVRSPRSPSRCSATQRVGRRLQLARHRSPNVRRAAAAEGEPHSPSRHPGRDGGRSLAGRIDLPRRAARRQEGRERSR
jgi:hypothetical protein